MFGRATIRLGIGSHSSFCFWFACSRLSGMPMRPEVYHIVSRSEISCLVSADDAGAGETAADHGRLGVLSGSL